MFTDNQAEILRILAGEPSRALSMSELGRLMGKAPGVFQRGLNSLEEDGYIVSRRKGNRRLIRFNTSHPLQEEIIQIVRQRNGALPADVYMDYPLRNGDDALRVAEPRADYDASSLKIMIIAGPNGAGKTTFAREFLPCEAGCLNFVNADYLAHGLSPFSPELAAVKAGKLMLRELDDHVRHQRNVAVETTLSGRRYARLIPRWRKQGYRVKLVFLSLPSVEIAIARVSGRMRQGGHPIPEETIRRRYKAGLRFFDMVYKPLVDTWTLYDNSGAQPVLIDEGGE